MPKGKSRAKSSNMSTAADSDDFILMYDDTEPTSSSTRGIKRTSDDVEYSASTNNDGNEFEKIMASFGADLNKTIQNKRKKIEAFAQESFQTSSKKIVDINSKQNTERHKLIDSYCKQVDTVLGQFEEDMIKMKEGEEKLSLLMKQHQKLTQQQRVVQTQRYKTMKQLKEDFTKNLELLDENHEKQLTKMQDEMKEEMSQLRKKILMDLQQKEMSSVRRSLQILAQEQEE